MLYDYPVVVPAGTSARAPVETTLKLTAGLIINLSVEFPAGCRGYVHTVIRAGGYQLYPTNPSGDLNAEDFTVQAWDFYPLLSAPFHVKAYSWSPEANYSHTLTVRIDLVRLDDLLNMLPFLKGLEALLAFVGVPAEEITPGPEVPPAPPTPPAPPVCEIGEQKCIGADLYECQEVDGVADWVLVEENSTQCEIVAPPEPEPPPPPPPPPEPEKVPSEGKILEVTWQAYNEEKIHPTTDPVPKETYYRVIFKIKNTGTVKAEYRIAFYRTGFGEGYYYSKPVTLSPGQVAYVDYWLTNLAVPGEYPITWYLFSYDKKVYELEVTHYGGPEVKE
jgi:hypothetical protein